ncbi:MAG: hypothetical protein ACP5KE_00320 [Candidatus Methanodesulfokora sp.]|jgi:galactitol-specific phosphotransferase system IIB component|nr:MAG: hypothetical protein C0200_00825 [Candidatus Korarchaeota archaeon]
MKLVRKEKKFDLKNEVLKVLQKLGLAISMEENIRGSSGIYHQIDFLVEKGDKKVAISVLDGDINVRRAMNLSLKKLDMGLDYIVISGEIPDEIKFMLKESSIIVIDNYDFNKLEEQLRRLL